MISSAKFDGVANSSPGDIGYGIVAFTYDAARQLLLRTDQLGDTCTTTYDLAGRRLSKAYRTRLNSPSGAIADTDSFTYDAASRLLSAISGRYNNTVAFTFDNASRLSTEALTVSGQTYTIARGYDVASRMTQLTYPDGSIVARTYTNRNQLAQVDYNTALAASFIYDAGRRETSRTFGNNLISTRTYRADNLTASINTPTVTSFAYTYDANKNKTAETIGGTMSPYGFTTGSSGYDAENRLTTFNRTDGAMNQSWNLSPVGDWTSFTQNAVVQTRTHGPMHELAAVGATPVLHDAKGNIIANSNGQVYTWDFNNRMTTVTVPNGAPGLEGMHTYAFDALGRRVSISVDTDANGTPDQTTVFVCKISPLQYSQSAGQVLAEYASGALPASPNRKYAYATYIDEPILLIDRTSAGAVISGADELFYYHKNHLYSVCALTDSTGAVTERYAYDAFGVTVFLNANGELLLSQISTVGNTYTYTGRRFDHETNLRYYRERMYDAALGRFLTRDPLGFLAGDINHYCYVDNHPTIAMDALGLDEIGQSGPFDTDDIETTWYSWRYKWIIQASTVIAGRVLFYAPIGQARFCRNGSSCRKRPSSELLGYSVGKKLIDYSFKYSDQETGWPDPNPGLVGKAKVRIQSVIIGGNMQKYVHRVTWSVPNCTCVTVILFQKREVYKITISGTIYHETRFRPAWSSPGTVGAPRRV